MYYEAVLMNPPYGSIGGPVTTEAKKYANRTVCLMPLSCYKKKTDELWRYVETMDLADPKMFADATITDNLCICTLRKSVVDKYKTYEEMAMESYDPKYKCFFMKNISLHSNTITDILTNAAIRDNWSDDTTFVESHRTGKDGVYKDSWGKKFNLYKSLTMDDLPHINDHTIRGFIVNFRKPIGKINFTDWWYKGKLADSIIHSMHFDGSPVIAIPQIDWEAISDTQLWKEGKYDEAVLLAMHLRWNDEKDGVEKTNLGRDTEVLT